MHKNDYRAFSFVDVMKMQATYVTKMGAVLIFWMQGIFFVVILDCPTRTSSIDAAPSATHRRLRKKDDPGGDAQFSFRTMRNKFFNQ
jgi:hypothetical protein